MEGGTPKRLRCGFTTGAAAAAAAKGALLSLLLEGSPKRVEITFLNGERTEISLHRVEKISLVEAVATVIKDGGDDPDITHNAEVGTRVKLLPRPLPQKVIITGGEGVGTVTKPGLEVAPGQPAINPGPLRMITNEVTQVLQQFQRTESIKVEVFVPEGEALARKTLNARLGIIGGLSILGTTGIEYPMSHEAYLTTIAKAVSVARACGIEEVVMTTGRRSERFCQMHWPEKPDEAFILIGDYFKASLEMAAKQHISRITLGFFFGKALKMAQGTPHTHAAKSRMSLPSLADWTERYGGDRMIAARVRSANTARQAYGLLKAEQHPVIEMVIQEVCHWAQRFAGPKVGIRVVLLDYEGQIVVNHPSDQYEMEEKK